jgi:hypothetical protein
MGRFANFKLVCNRCPALVQRTFGNVRRSNIVYFATKGLTESAEDLRMLLARHQLRHILRILLAYSLVLSPIQSLADTGKTYQRAVWIYRSRACPPGAVGSSKKPPGTADIVATASPLLANAEPHTPINCTQLVVSKTRSDQMSRIRCCGIQAIHRTWASFG